MYLPSVANRLYRGLPHAVPRGLYDSSLLRFQILASTAKNLLLLEIGMIQGYPTILLPAVQNVAGPLGIDDYHASWIGKESVWGRRSYRSFLPRLLFIL